LFEDEDEVVVGVDFLLLSSVEMVSLKLTHESARDPDEAGEDDAPSTEVVIGGDSCFPREYLYLFVIFLSRLRMCFRSEVQALS
jgi:hypothetical protein